MPATTKKPKSWFRPDPQNLREIHDAEKLQLLHDSMVMRGQLDAVVSEPDGRIVDGHWRHAAAMLDDAIKELDVIILDAPLTDQERLARRLTGFLHRTDLTDAERWEACERLMKMNGWGQKELAAHLNLKQSSVSVIMAASNCDSEWQDSFRKGIVCMSQVREAAKLPLDMQGGLLAFTLGNGENSRPNSRPSRDEVIRKCREMRGVDTPPKPAKPKGKGKTKDVIFEVALPGGVLIKFIGPAMTMAAAQQAIPGAMEEMANATKQRLDDHAAQMAFRSRARQKGKE